MNGDTALELVFTLRRIAVALEKIEGHMARGVTTAPRAFLWAGVSRRCRETLKKAVEDGALDGLVKFKWPLTCQDLVHLGCRRLLELKGWGTTCAVEVDNVLQETGFCSDWLET